ncbi:MAG: MOSC domain-containing protein [Burkholderiaceae bacterium]
MTPADAQEVPRVADVPRVVAVHRNSRHALSKWPEPAIGLVVGHGVAGDAHYGTTVQHRSRVAVNASQPNLRQVHVLHAELLDALRAQGFKVDPGTLGENVTTRGIDLLALPRGARLRLGKHAVIEITGLRNPCKQLDRFQPGLTQAVLDQDESGRLIRKSGVMAIVVKAGEVLEDDLIKVTLPKGVPQALEPV